MSLQLNIWLLLFGGLQGLLLSFFLLKKKTFRHGYGFLLAYLLVMMAQIIFKVLDKQWLMEESRSTYFLSYQFPLLYGPLAWFFMRQLLCNEKKFSPIDFLHFLPFVYSIVILNITRLPNNLAWFSWPLEANPAVVLQVISLAYYHLIAFRVFKQQESLLQSTDLLSFQKWVRSFLSWSLLICLSISVLTYFIYTWYPAHNWLRFGFLLLTVFIYFSRALI